jgi:signal transduction histidine kinase/ligand-binding sensor domain-containing protein
VRGPVLTCMLLALCHRAFALNPGLDVSQYAHTAWKLREGFSIGRITGMAQTPDGFLWLGTEFGLLHFDGVRAVPWQPPTGQHLPDNYIRALLATRDGTLWIGTLKGLANWNGGKLTQYPELSGRYVDALIEDRDGTVWAGGSVPTGRVCAIQKSRVRCYGDDGSLGLAVESLYENSVGNIWVGASTGLWRWKPGPPKRYPASGPLSGKHAVIEDDKGALLISGTNGLSQLVDGKMEHYPVPGAARRVTNSHLFWDRDGVLWIGTLGGLVHVHEGRTDAFSQSDGLSGDSIGNIFEDRERNIWVATSGGLDRFRDVSVVTLSVRQGLSNDTVGTVLADRDGSIWLGTADGLNRWKKGQITIPSTGSGKRDGKFNGLNSDALFQDARGRIWVATRRGIGYLENDEFVSINGVPGGVVRSMAEDDAGNLWIASQDHGLLRVSPANDVEQIPWATLGHKVFALTLAAEPSRGGIWLGFYQGGIAYVADGQIRASYAAADGLGEGLVQDVRLDQKGVLWAATENGLSRVTNGRVATLTSKSGLPCDTVHWSIEDDAHSVWLYMACGLVRIARPELDAWAAAVDQGDKDAKPTIRAAVFDTSDGVGTHAVGVGFSHPVAKSSDGRLWFLTVDGVSVVDPGHLSFNKLPPPVYVEQITADRKTYNTTSERNANVRLPPLVRDLEIDYTALSLVVPEKNRFKVKLEGWDRDWQDVGHRRQAYYTNLPPRNYRFRVTASNNSGVWNETGAFLDFSVAPAYYQTIWFRSSVAVAFLALGVGLYQLRLRQVARQFNVRFEERVNERTRIARDLHDTLLQSFQAVLLKFHALTYTIPPEAQKTLQSVLDEAAQAIDEGRDAVQGLRASTVASHDLVSIIRALGDELAGGRTGEDAPDFRMHVEGAPRDLAPLVQDDVYRIAGEALRNAFRHAHARQIEVDVRYDPRQFRVRVRDDGKGIDQQVLDGAGRAGHYGLAGMRERATLVRGHLTVWSERDSGTEIELTIPSSVAYAKSPAARPSAIENSDSMPL